MEFDLELLRRDWLDALPGEEFYRRVILRRAQLDEGLQILCKNEPIEFAVELFAAVSLGRALVLTNPKWGTLEQAELKGLLERETPKSGSILIPTGGTTGGVKLAIHDWASLCASARGVQEFLGGGAIDSCCCLPLYHVSGLMQLVRSYVSGGCIRFDDSEVAGACLSYVPTQLQRALESEESIQKLTTARAIFIGGAAMPESLAHRARELKLPVIPVYGMTETAAMCAAIPKEDFLKDPQAGAIPLGEAQFSIEDGQIRVQTPALFKGYQGRGLIDMSQGYLAGDQGSIDVAGRLHVLGRIDRLINTGGEKVDPREVESALLQIEGVESARVYGEPDSEWGQIAVARLCATAGLDIEAVRAELKTKLSPYKIPKRFYV